MNPDLRDIIFLDIETVRVEDKHETLNERLKSQWARKAGFFKRQEGQTDADLFEERAGIYAEFGKVITIAFGRYFETETGELGLKTRYYTSENEQEILIKFKEMLDKQDSHEIIARQSSPFIIERRASPCRRAGLRASH